MYKYQNFPIEIKKEEYINQQNFFIKDIIGNSRIVSIYSIGELGLYGVSDLDYLIIYIGCINEKKIYEIAKKYNLIDTILFLEITNLENKNYISHHYKYDLVFGEDLQLTFDTANANLNIIYAWRVCFFSLLRNFYAYKYSKNISVKNLLSQINDLRYPVYFLNNLGVNTKKYDLFLQDFSEYRTNYFSHTNFDELELFLEKSINLSWELINDLSIFLGDNQVINSYEYGRFPTKYISGLQENNYRNITENKLKHIGRISRYLCLPQGFNYKYWNKDLKNDLDKIIINNKLFLNFGFDNVILKIALLIKKILDIITIRIIGNKN